MKCPICEGVMIKHRDYETVQLKGKTFGADRTVYRCNKCSAGFTTTETDTEYYENLKEEKTKR